MPTVASTTNSTASARPTAISAWAAIRSASPRASGSQPPVSTTVKARPLQLASYETRSRVTPGTSSTTASRRPMIRLTSVDLPTLGRPTTASTGTGPATSSSSAATSPDSKPKVSSVTVHRGHEVEEGLHGLLEGQVGRVDDGDALAGSQEV